MQQPGESQPPTAPPIRRGRRWGRLVVVGVALLAVGIVVGAVLSGLGVAGAGTPSPSPMPRHAREWPGHGFRHGGWPGPGEPGTGPFHRGGFLGPGLGSGAEHGQVTVPIPGGGSRTIAFQEGTVTSVSGSSIGVKSDDGYAMSYRLDDGTMVEAGLHGIGDVHEGDVVRVLAVGTGANNRTVNVADETALRRARGMFPGAPMGSPPG